MSLFGIHPVRIDGTAMFARAISLALRERGIRSVLCFPSAPVPAVREFLSLSNVTIEANEKLFSSGMAESALSFLPLVRRHRPTVVHLHFMQFVSLFPSLAKLGGVRKLFFTDHGSRQEDFPIQPKKTAWRELVKKVLSRPIDQVIVVSGYVLQCQLALNQIPETRYRRIYNGIDLQRVTEAENTPQTFRLRFGIPANRVLITLVSWMIEEKGVSDFVAAARLVLAQLPDVHFCLAGEGTSLAAQQLLVSQAGLAQNFTFTGQLADPFFDGVFGASDVICQPSRWQEAFGWVLGEAMAFGKPIVATHVGGIPEIVLDQVTGFLVPPRDTSALARRLIDLASDPALRERMGLAGRHRVSEHFALHGTVNSHVELYGIQITPTLPHPATTSRAHK